MPTTRERLHKAALVPPQGSAKYDLLLLDHQTAGVAATFWRETFLNATAIVDGRLGAIELKDGVLRAHRRLIDEKIVSPIEADKLRDHVAVALQTPRVRISAFVQNLPFSEEGKAVVDEELKKKFPGTRTVPIDVPYAGENITRKTRLRGAYGFLLEIEADHWEEVVKENVEIPGTTIRRIVLEVPDVRWVK